MLGKAKGLVPGVGGGGRIGAFGDLGRRGGKFLVEVEMDEPDGFFWATEKLRRLTAQ